MYSVLRLVEMNGEMDLDNLRIEYLRYNDPTEYTFANKVIGSWSNWEKLREKNKDIIDSWQRELEAKIKSNAISMIFEVAQGETRDALSANKLLLDCPWKESTRGRPSKLDIQTETKRIVDDSLKTEEDYALYQSRKEQV